MKTKFLSLLIALFAYTLGFAQELVTNGDFENGTTGWSGNALNVIDDGSGNHVNAADVAAAGPAYNVNISNVLTITNGTSYVFSFDAYSDRNRTIVAGFGENHGPYNSTTVTPTLTTTKKRYTYVLTANGYGDANCRVLFDMGAEVGYVAIDNVSLQVVSSSNDGTLSDLKVDGTTIPGFSSSTYSYSVDLPQGTTTVPTVTATPTQAGANAVVTPAASVPGTTTVEVTAADGVTKLTYNVSFAVAGPTGPAPTPTVAAPNVASIYSDTYSPATTADWNPVWDSDNVIDLMISGNNTRKITGGGFLGIDFSGSTHLNLTNATKMHMDVWVDALNDGWVFNPKVVDFGGGAAEASSVIYSINAGTTPTLVPGQWNSLDITLTGTRSDIAQVVITSNIPTFYVDNFYFYNPTSALGTSEVSAKNNLKIYPNPVAANSSFNITGNVKTVKVFSMNGQLVKTAKAQNVNTQGLSKGVYIVEAVQEDGTVKRTKLMVK